MATSSTRTRPTLQPTGWMMLKSRKRTTVNARLAGAERDRAWRVGGEEHRDRKHAPQHRLVRPDAEHEQRAYDDSGGGPGERADDRPAGAERVRPQHGERAEDDPEAVLKPRPLGDVDGDREPDGTAEAVSEPHRSDARVLDRQSLGGFECGNGPRRLGHIEVVELGDTGSARQQSVSRSLARRVGHRANSERSVERPRYLASRGIGWQLRQSPHECACNVIACRFEPLEIGLSVAALESLGARHEECLRPPPALRRPLRRPARAPLPELA